MAVTPRVGVWIETAWVISRAIRVWVTPRVGVWIETNQSYTMLQNAPVTPRVGVWIETLCVKWVLRK